MSSAHSVQLPTDRYRVLSILAEGRMAILYSVLNETLQREEVAKVVRGGLPEEQRTAFDREVRVAKELGGEPGLPLFWEAGPHGAGLFGYMLMEAGGEPLSRTESWGLERALEVTLSLAAAVGSVHRRGYLHNGVCPSNVLVRRYAESRLIDFGAACRLEDAVQQLPLACEDQAQIPYVAPELRAGGLPSVRSDLYGVGAVLHYLLTGAPPSPDADGQNLQLPADVCEVLRRTIALDPGHRYATAQELRAEMQGLCDRYGSDDTTTMVVNRRDEVGESFSLVPRRPTLDFGDVDSGAGGSAPTRTFEVRSAVEEQGRIECDKPWLQVRPQTFAKGLTEVTVGLAPQNLPEGRESEARVRLRVPGRGGSHDVYCRVRCVGGVDLVLVLDTIADAERLRARCEFAEGVFSEARTVLSELGELRVGILGYGDHGLKGDLVHPPGLEPLHRYDLAEPQCGYQALAQLRPVWNRDFEAALEDAVAALERLAWRPLSSHLLVTIGNRPPHPASTGWLQQVASPSGHDWQRLLVGARKRLGLRSVSIVDPVVWSGASLPGHAEAYMADVWREFGDVAVLRYEDTTPSEVVRLLAGSVGRGEVQP